MTAHEIARQLLELPEDTMIIYENHEDRTICTKVENIRILKAGAPKDHPLHDKLQELINKGQMISTYVVLNPSDD